MITVRPQTWYLGDPGGPAPTAHVLVDKAEYPDGQIPAFTPVHLVGVSEDGDELWITEGEAASPARQRGQ